MDKALSWLFDGVVKKSHKIIVVFSIILLAILIDNSFNFSFHYDYQRRLAEVELINKILADSSVDNSTKHLLRDHRHRILFDKNSINRSFRWASGITLSNNVNSILANKTTPANIIKPNTTPSLGKKYSSVNPAAMDTMARPEINKATASSDPKGSSTSIRNRYWQFFSSSFFYVIMMFVAPILYIRNGSISSSQFVATLIVSFVIFGLFAMVFNFLTGLIPRILGNYTYNYILNALIQLVLILGFFKSIVDTRRSRTT